MRGPQPRPSQNSSLARAGVGKFPTQSTLIHGRNEQLHLRPGTVARPRDASQLARERGRVAGRGTPNPHVVCISRGFSPLCAKRSPRDWTITLTNYGLDQMNNMGIGNGEVEFRPKKSNWED